MFLYLFFSTWICPGFTLQPEGIPCCLGNAAPVRTAVLTERIKQVLQSYITLISTSPKSLLTDGDPRACCLELTTNEFSKWQQVTLT
jgi:hypothetical protein